MSAGRRRGLVLRGRSLCQWDGERYVRLFAARRGRIERRIFDISGELRAGWFGEPCSGMDAPGLLPGGSMLGCVFDADGLLMPSVVVRGGE